MDDLKRMAIFATVVQRGSMTAAAKVLGMSASAVSQHIRQLERDSGVTLLHRSTRQIALTDAGQRFYTQCAVLTAAATAPGPSWLHSTTHPQASYACLPL